MNGRQFAGDGNGKKTARKRIKPDRPIFGRCIGLKNLYVFISKY
jgi:hypothetical protein